jgi:hypothetical protein
MRHRLFRSLGVALLTLVPFVTSAQVNYQTTQPPTVSAESEAWFEAQEPIMFAGNVYYPGGARVFFNRNEMVRSGFYRGIPLFTKTTVEPYSLVFVPVSGGQVQPYERRRAGELAGSVGSTVPSYPVGTPYQSAQSDPAAGLPQAAGPPTNISAPLMVGTSGTTGSPGIIGTTGDAIAPVSPVSDRPAADLPTSGSASTPPGRLVSAEKPLGLNGVFVDYDGRRWFSSGPAVALDPARLTELGRYRGFRVYADRARPNDTIYIAVAESADAVVAPYSLRRR